MRLGFECTPAGPPVEFTLFYPAFQIDPSSSPVYVRIRIRLRQTIAISSSTIFRTRLPVTRMVSAGAGEVILSAGKTDEVCGEPVGAEADEQASSCSALATLTLGNFIAPPGTVRPSWLRLTP